MYNPDSYRERRKKSEIEVMTISTYKSFNKPDPTLFH